MRAGANEFFLWTMNTDAGEPLMEESTAPWKDRAS
jgi:hypothetical protein